MNSSLKQQINDLAKDVLKVYNIKTPIKDMNSVVEVLGGTVKEDSSLGLYSDGIVQKEGNGFSIFVPKDQNKRRKNFTIAHELGHLFLHMGYQIDDELWNKSDHVVFNRKGNSEIEMQANEFAAAFLMPKEEYKKVMDQNSDGNTVYISEVADYFNVSIDAASYRGKWLGYLQW